MTCTNDGVQVRVFAILVFKFVCPPICTLVGIEHFPSMSGERTISSRQNPDSIRQVDISCIDRRRTEASWPSHGTLGMTTKPMVIR
ncbi:hypothetical protein LY76DRAFT_36297 [Colletotrichum caudatum]|nr:hypothetical protein LY76DRAFT_36297 [Colletotrichum caudatum]